MKQLSKFDRKQIHNGPHNELLFWNIGKFHPMHLRIGNSSKEYDMENVGQLGIGLKQAIITFY